MDGMVTFGRASLLCTLLICFSLQVCWAIVTVTVTPKVEVIKGESASLPCTFKIPPSPNNIVEWFIEEGGTRKRVAFRSVSGGEGKSDEGTRLSDRVTMGRDFSLTISPVTVEDQLPFYCQVTAGPAGVGEAITQLKVFFAPEMPEVTGSNQAISVGDSSTQVGFNYLSCKLPLSSNVLHCPLMVFHCLPMFFHCPPMFSIVLQCSSIVFQCSSIVFQCSSIVLQCSSIVFQCSSIVLQCSSIVFQCSSIVLQCSPLSSNVLPLSSNGLPLSSNVLLLSSNVLHCHPMFFH
ncbi:basal cell adhesion molecule-like isoform X2 [Oncorhynchus keta]|uniref:basal cell adhesion molecule-like isoform X2 n=1 Tax=Oncorhynchus keta TaxID=8018 RepID=UPI00227C5C86|nr:basal cell adhesion molecule-like isoform X2 [Oncorhynchus keta]